MSVERTTKPVDRETLYVEVWAEPVSVVAPRYGLSDVGLAKICRTLAIPLPSRGYWAKVKAGRIMRKVPLPPLEKDTRRVPILAKLPPEQVAMREAAKEASARIRREVTSLAAEEVLSAPVHSLVRAASKRLRQREGWPADSLIRSAPKEVLHLSVTRGTLDRALSFMDGFLKAVALQSFEVMIDEARGMSLLQHTATNTTLEFTLSEHVRRTRHEITPTEQKAQKRYWERSRWDSSSTYPQIPMYDYTPTGILTLEVGRWPKRSWKDTPTRNLEKRLGEVIAGVVAVAEETYEREQAEKRREEARRKAIARYEFLTKRRAAETEKFTAVEQTATDWERALRLRKFADAFELNVKTLGPLSEDQANWLAWVRAKADWLDPFVLVCDPILDAPEPRRPGY